MEKKLYRVAALDMDGTLLNEVHEITPYTRQVIERASRAGGVIALCTGRALSELTEHLKENPCIRYVITQNGGCVLDLEAGRTLYSAPIDREAARTALALSHEYDLVLQVFLGNQSCLRLEKGGELERYGLEYFRPVFEVGSVWDPQLKQHYEEGRLEAGKINLYFASEADREEYRTRLEALGTGLIMVPSIACGLELTDPGAQKGIGLSRLCEALGVPISEAMAVGDGGNDVDMLRTAGLAVAMGNASPEVLAVADVVTEDNRHDGAAKAIERYMAGEYA